MIDGHGLGRIAAPDPRDTLFLMRRLPKAVPRKQRKYPYKLGPTLDQGPTPRCVGFSSRHKLTAAPIMVKDESSPSPDEIYRGAQDNDEWDGNDYEGTSVRGSFKWMAQSGYLKSYVWAKTSKEMHDFLHNGYGTIVVGTEFYSQMENLDANGFAHPVGQNLGGHAYHCFWSVDKGSPATSELHFQNSWSGSWGITLNHQPGCFKITWLEFDYLLDRDGEAGAGIERKVVPKS